MYRIITFGADSLQDLEDKINAWLSENDGKATPINISISDATFNMPEPVLIESIFSGAVLYKKEAE